MLGVEPGGRATGTSREECVRADDASVCSLLSCVLSDRQRSLNVRDEEKRPQDVDAFRGLRFIRCGHNELMSPLAAIADRKRGLVQSDRVEIQSWRRPGPLTDQSTGFDEHSVEQLRERGGPWVRVPLMIGGRCGI